PPEGVAERIAIVDREVLQQRRVDETEDRGVRADAKRERKNGGDGKAATLPQRSRGVHEISPEIAQQVTPRRPRRNRLARERLPQRPHLAVEQVFIVDLVDREPHGLVVTGARCGQLLVTIVETL